MRDGREGSAWTDVFGRTESAPEDGPGFDEAAQRVEALLQAEVCGEGGESVQYGGVWLSLTQGADVITLPPPPHTHTHSHTHFRRKGV